jgi:hypothetical protein
LVAREDWDYSHPIPRSFLVHELVHRAQCHDGRWAVGEILALECEAYAAQIAFLRAAQATAGYIAVAEIEYVIGALGNDGC